MLAFANSSVSRIFSCLALAVIVIFNIAAFYSCIQILQEEQKTISTYQQKLSQKRHLEEILSDFTAKTLAYFEEDQPDEFEIEDISDTFLEFQNSFLYYNDVTKGKNLELWSPEEIGLINAIQENSIKIMSHLPLFIKGKQIELQEVIEVIIEEIETIKLNLRKFGEYQTKQAELYLSSEALGERRNRILVSLSILGLSSLFLIIFLFFRNNRLEIIGEKKQEMFHLADQRIQAIEASNDGIAIVGPDHRLLFMNKALAELHGIPIEEKETYIGKDWKELYNAKGQDDIEKHVYPELYKNGEWRGESPIERKDGKIIEAELSITLLPDEAGMIGTARDISGRRQAEEQRKELQNQIYQAQKMEAVGRLAGGVAHDFNNILAAIMGYAEFLSEDLEHDKKLKKFADNILMAGQKGRGLIDQMLTFSRRKESHMSVVDLRLAIDETISMISAGLPKSIELDVVYHHDKKAYINGDASQISQALMNIVVNAVDAMENEKGELHISLFRIDPDEDMFEGMMNDDFLPKDEMPPIHIQSLDGGQTILEMGKLKRGQNYFQISVSDTGTGIAEAVMEHIFEPFFTTKAVDKGTGLGMANVHGAIVAHQGAMIVDTILMEGTTFDLFFPQADHIDDVSLLQEKGIAQDQKKDFSNVKILLVDDQPEVLGMMETLLTRSGIKSVSKPSAMEALQYLRETKEQFDMVITDQNMPGMTGVEFAEQCAALRPELPFIIVSGYSRERLHEIRMEYLNIKEAIRKPANKETLLAAIRSVLK